MNQPTVYCITQDLAFFAALESRLAAQRTALTLVRQWPHPAITREEAERQELVMIVDVDDARSEAIELLQSYPNSSAMVIGSEGSEETLCDIQTATGCEILLKDKENRCAQLLPTLIRKMLRDRDRHETANDMLRSSEKRYEDLIEAIPDIVYKIEPSGHFSFVNKAVSTIGYTPVELIGRHFSEILITGEVPRVSRNQVLPEMHGVITGPADSPGLFDERRTGDRGTRALEVRIRRKGDSGSFIGSISAFGEISATGHYRSETQTRFFTGTVGIIRDITQRKRSEQMLQRLSIAMEQSNTAISIATSKGIVEYANPYFLRLNGFRPEELIGHNMFDLMQDHLQEETVEQVREAIRNETVWEGDTIVWRGDGESYWSWMKVYPITGFDGTVGDIVFFQEDITDRKQTETLLRERLSEKESLMRRIHEQMKNGLQAMEHVLAVRHDAGDQESVRTELARVSCQVHSVAVVLDSVVAGSHPMEVALGRYLTAMMPWIARRNEVDPAAVTWESDLDVNRFPVDTAVPLGLLLEEVLSYIVGSLGVRHIRIAAHRDGDHNVLTLHHRVTDDLAQPGTPVMPPIIELLAAQFDANLSRTDIDGALYTIRMRNRR